ncbi:HpcH/HpaI aldolase/citrate lyase family protein [Yersinia enterocolitica]|uniref:HpcH/HpaI aldolase/citrate lyase family protein n=1 Tax=Rahnella perminowiae TaxID=2816244 RepID=A0ABS6KVW2_9GAMM|nr:MULTISPECIES: HpcH/HpaI aldolase/citrate lyase family protein [Yersiniaceae]MBU9826714.1 HpcH/HpaI aldolase/citrate lyase family protein [Rahnella perminowiae]MBU9833750.1 HpcH/HpaI aldolase/citrate lyase family protein [Rahnella perminowiae]MCC3721305.1 HpcH/HpaI aldolase/citrate lyase family protein [Rouxiella badensis]MCC3729442.1 HpcH/HpaI aldolase/citrate lyase family protein [Rouxiella badensis]
MTKRLSPYRLGATLYMPATRSDIAKSVLNNEIEGLRSIVICLEDAVSEADVPAAMNNLKQILTALRSAKAEGQGAEWPLVFIRPRHVEMGQYLTTSLDLSPVDGLVLPKFTLASLPQWWDIMKDTHLCMMPTLETEDVFDVMQMRELATTLVGHPCHNRIIALRIGGNDLMNVISLRRPRNLTLYDSPMGYVIKMLVAVFGSRDFSLTSPVCEHIDDHNVMEQELALDMAHGLVGKTAIHPNQIAKIERALMVTPADHADALRILNSSQAVFKSQGAMCEPATHRRWASRVLEQAQVYGIAQESLQESVRLVTLTNKH